VIQEQVQQVQVLQEQVLQEQVMVQLVKALQEREKELILHIHRQ
jgi:hypothetical protein